MYNPTFRSMKLLLECNKLSVFTACFQILPKGKYKSRADSDDILQIIRSTWRNEKAVRLFWNDT